ncbi:glycosyltransferase [Dyadobacter sp. CY323]|uniref:glycosyltransferase n=1 Tax=Dyadobacter sp. CY323 TaxID=2907302 RepID=UPI001F2D8DE8|nr:glycosyltransferase [Dyadobacter sp. CY323]MCE6992729.1 glycosyltransferase [Dyadobacter sp. CY323]
MSDSLAPIVLFCYNRPWHLRQTIESLRANSLASQSNLFIYSDGPRNDTDEPLVAEIRKYISHIEGFNNVFVIAAEKNKGLATSVISGVTEILNQYKKIIVLEDDMLSTPDFLTFMNDALDIYQDRADIFSVTGYTPPIAVPADYTKDIYLAPRASSWGWGTWREKWRKADWEIRDFERDSKDPSIAAGLNLGGSDLWPMLLKQQKGVIDSWAIRWTFTQFKNEAYGLYPVRSKIKNIGTDGTGTNFTFKSGNYGKEMDAGKVTLDPGIERDAGVINAFRHYYKLPFRVKIKNWVKYRI